MNILVDKTPVYYLDEGQGPVVLMLHGWGSSLATFNELAKELSADYRVVRLDLPGFGRTPFTAEAGWKLQDYADFIESFLDKLNLRKVDVLVGHSLGGRLAIKLAAGNLKLSRLVLLGAHGLKDGSRRKVLYRLVAKTGKFATAWLPANLRGKLRNRLYRSAGATDYLNVSGPMKETFKNIIDEDLAETAAQVSVKTLLIYGSNDEMTPPEFGRQFKELIKQSKLEIVEGAGHYVHEEAVSEVRQLIKGFLK